MDGPKPYTFIPHKIMMDIIHDMQKRLPDTDICDEAQNIFLELLLNYYDPNIKIYDSIKHEIEGISHISLVKNALHDYGFLGMVIQWKNLEHAFVLINTELDTYIVDSYVNVRCISHRKFDFDKLINMRSLEDWNKLFLAHEAKLRNERDIYTIFYGYYPLNYSHV